MKSTPATHPVIHSFLTTVLLCTLILFPSPPARAAGLLIADGGLGGVLDIQAEDADQVQVR